MTCVRLDKIPVLRYQFAHRNCLMGLLNFLDRLLGTPAAKQLTQEPAPKAAGVTPESANPPQGVTEHAPGPTPAVSPPADAAPLTVYSFVDLETTGLDPERDRITEIALVNVTMGQSSHDLWTTLINPGMPVPDQITKITGITDEMVKDAPGEECLLDYFDRIGDNVVFAYNAPFDMGFLSAAARRLGREFNNPSRCVMQLVKELHPDLWSYKLQRVCDAFGISSDDNYHRAQADIISTVKLWQAVRTGAQPDSAEVRPDPTAREWTIWGHYARSNGDIFYVHVSRDGGKSEPEDDFDWQEYVQQALGGLYDVRVIARSVTIGEATTLRNNLYYQHGKLLINRYAFRTSLQPYTDGYRKCIELIDSGKALEKSDIPAAVATYLQAMQIHRGYVNLPAVEGVFGEFFVRSEMRSRCREGAHILDRLSILMRKTGQHKELQRLVHDYLRDFPVAAQISSFKKVLARQEKLDR